LSSQHNPILEPNLPNAGPSGVELPPGSAPSPEPNPATAGENPPWTGWDVLQIAFLMFVTPFVILAGVAVLAHLLVYRTQALTEVAQKPSLAILSEFLAYIGVLGFMVAMVQGKYHRRFYEALRWNWPAKIWASLAALGVVLLFALQGLGHLLPIPKDLPLDKFFAHPTEAYLTSVFAISFGPFMEEVFFRGFLYPVLARRWGTVAGVALTALGFGLLHGLQLGFAWGPVFIIFLVGAALTIVRAVTGSVGASFVVHVAYNSTLSLLTFVATSGFHHLERLNQ